MAEMTDAEGGGVMGCEPEFKVGDKVVCIDAYGRRVAGLLRRGERYTVREVSNFNGHVRIYDYAFASNIRFFRANRFELAPQPEPAPKFKEGDTVEITLPAEAPFFPEWIGLRCVAAKENIWAGPSATYPHGNIFLRPLTVRPDTGNKTEFFWPTEGVKLVEEAKPRRRTTESIVIEGLRAANEDLLRTIGELRSECGEKQNEIDNVRARLSEARQALG